LKNRAKKIRKSGSKFSKTKDFKKNINKGVEAAIA